MVNPSPQIAVHKQLLSQESYQVRQRPTEAGPQLQILDQQHGNQPRPDLRLQRVLRSAHKRLQAQILLERLKQLTYILPINIVRRKPRSTIDSIPCVHIACRQSGFMSGMTSPTMSYAVRMAGRWR